MSDIQINKAYNNYKTLNVKCLEKNGFNFVKNRKDNDNLSNVVFEIKKPAGNNGYK